MRIQPTSEPANAVRWSAWPSDQVAVRTVLASGVWYYVIKAYTTANVMGDPW